MKHWRTKANKYQVVLINKQFIFLFGKKSTKRFTGEKKLNGSLPQKVSPSFKKSRSPPATATAKDTVWRWSRTITLLLLNWKKCFLPITEVNRGKCTYMSFYCLFNQWLAHPGVLGFREFYHLGVPLRRPCLVFPPAVLTPVTGHRARPVKHWMHGQVHLGESGSLKHMDPEPVYFKCHHQHLELNHENTANHWDSVVRPVASWKDAGWCILYQLNLLAHLQGQLNVEHIAVVQPQCN